MLMLTALAIWVAVSLLTAPAIGAFLAFGKEVYVPVEAQEVSGLHAA